MAFKRLDTEKRKMQLISLMDMAFILLLFFLVTVFIAHPSQQEQKLYVPTPENVRGRAQIMIQLLPDNQFVWIDESSTAIVESIQRDFGYLAPSTLKAKIIDDLLRRNTLESRRLRNRLERLVKQADKDPNAEYFVLIRCPDEIAYFRVVDIIKRLSDCKYHNIKYGCVGGTIDQIRNCKQIRVIRKKGRENLWIDF